MIKLTIVARGDFIEIRPHQQGKSKGPNGRAQRNEAPSPQNDRRPEEDTADPMAGARRRPEERAIRKVMWRIKHDWRGRRTAWNGRFRLACPRFIRRDRPRLCLCLARSVSAKNSRTGDKLENDYDFGRSRREGKL